MQRESTLNFMLVNIIGNRLVVFCNASTDMRALNIQLPKFHDIQDFYRRGTEKKSQTIRLPILSRILLNKNIEEKPYPHDPIRDCRATLLLHKLIPFSFWTKPHILTTFLPAGAESDENSDLEY